ncbi:MAG: undecaprenyl-phosphate glucose phosphotransferase [Lachnospiraceae bacterium]|nr:undecaprenyl-phosphate glucose phosphotransferase [Lachnospiraceae bacterium]
MIKDNQKYFNRMHVVIDGLIVAGSYYSAWFLKFKSGLLPVGEAWLSDEYYFFPLIFIVPGFLILYHAFNLYTPKRVQGRRVEAANLFKANTTGTFLFIFILYMINQPDFSRQMIFIFYFMNMFVDVLVRNIIRTALRKARQMGYNQKYILLVGYSRSAEEYISRIIANPEWGYIIRGVLDDDIERGTVYKGVKILGKIDNLPYILPNANLDEIAITLSIDKYGDLERIVGMCEKSGVHTKFIPDYNNIIPTRPYTEDVLGLPVVNIRYVPLTNTFNQVIKRTTDIVGSLVCIVLFSPVMLVTAIAIKTTSKGPLIFKQERVGRHNRPFNMYKFRSMEEQTSAEEEKGWTVKNDPRITNVGRFIRKTSIDELPQLFNVFKGDMSLVGPRPERPRFVEQFKDEIPRYMIKHQVRPGMTGWAQINGYRGNTSIRKRIDYDLYYIENWTIGLDFKILFLTIFKGFINKNAY